MTLSIWATAVTIWLRPCDCSLEAVAISPMSSSTLRACSTICCSELATLPEMATPWPAFWIESSMLVVVSRAAWAQRWARARTSSATTAKPAPASPARAASTAALSARMLVWKAISSMVLMIFAKLSEEV